MAKKHIKPFQFKQFSIAQDRCAMKVGTDGVLLGAWADTSHAQRILDIGTGTGVIAVMLAQKATKARVHGIEIDADACMQATENMAASPFASRLKAIKGDVLDYVEQEKYDLIVSNPPFFSGGTLTAAQARDAVRHTVKLPHGALLSAARSLLSPEGKFAVILPFIEGLRFVEMANSYNLFLVRKTEVRSKAEKPVERLLLEFEKTKKDLQESSLIIQKEKRNDWTQEYMALTGDFYLKM